MLLDRAHGSIAGRWHGCLSTAQWPLNEVLVDEAETSTSAFSCCDHGCRGTLRRRFRTGIGTAAARARRLRRARCRGDHEDSKAFKSLRAQAEKTQKQIKSDFDRQQKQFDDEGRKLVQQKDKLSSDDLQKKSLELRQRAHQQTEALKTRQRNLDQSVAKGQDQILHAMVDVVKDVAKAHGQTLVLMQSATLYFDPSYDDISKEVKRKLDAKLPSLKLQQ